MPYTHAQIIELGAVGLANAIQGGEVTARQAVNAYIERIEAVNPKINALVIPLFESAREQADLADEKQGRGERLGPLHGVPITIKETFDIQDVPTSFGLTAIDGGVYKAQKDAVLVAQLREAGAIILGKTNIPQLAFYLESDNPVYGRTNNPWDLDRSPMGSTGGEAALIAAGGSALGLGSDLAGSARVPAFACGIHSLKATSRRLNGIGHPTAMPGQEALTIDFGTMARHVEDLKLSFEVLAQATPHDTWKFPPVPVPKLGEVSLQGMKIGYYTDNNFFPASPSIRRAVEESTQALRALGAELVEFPVPDMREGMRIFFGLLSAGNYRSVKTFLHHSKHDWRLNTQIMSVTLPKLVRKLVVPLMRMLGQHYVAENLGMVGKRSVNDYWKLTVRLEHYRQAFYDQMDALGVDAIISPPYAVPAFKHGGLYPSLKRSSQHTLNLAIACSYALLYNILGMPTGIVAATRVRPDEESDRPESRDWVVQIARDIEQGSAGLPIGVQVAARYWREDIVLAVMEALETHFRQQPDYPSAPPL